ncbi:MAG: VWA domain-containing protein, partial [Clostridia bacterium]|nr:VWA domain-containing protein [Clostridia bacterium]
VKGLTRSEQGIFYVYMLDVSASIPEAHFSAAKAAVLDAWSRLREQDSLALITFGNEVTLLLEGGESRSKVTETIDSLRNTDNSTKFYNAMDSLIELVLQTKDMRRVAVVISDGIDDTDAGMTQEELEEKLVRTGVSVSAMCIDTTSEAVVGSFGDFIRLSGGELFVFGPSDAGSVLNELLDRLSGGWLLSLEAPTNIVSGEEETLSVDFGGAASLEVQVVPERWTPDDKPPRVEDVDYSAESNAFIVTFSEAVTGADNAGAYVLTDQNGAAFPISAVEVTGGFSCRLDLAGPMPEEGSLTLTISGLADVSMEQNEMYKYSEIVWSGEVAPVQSPENASEAEEEPLVEMSTMIIIGTAVLLVAAALLIILKMSSKKSAVQKVKKPKKHKDEADPVKSTATFMFLGNEKDEKGGTRK